MKSIKMMLLPHLPYILLLAANLIYLAIYGFKPLRHHPQLWIYNFILFLIVGVLVFFKFSYHLYQWFVKGDGDIREKTKGKIREAIKFVEIVKNYFRPGNLHNLVYLYSILAIWTLFSYLIPPLLLGFFFSFVYQLRVYLNKNYPNFIQKLNQFIQNFILKIEESLPRYQSDGTRLYQ